MSKNKKNNNPNPVEETSVVTRKGRVSVPLLNCRMAPNLDAELCEFGPLKEDTIVDVINEEKGWIEAEWENKHCYLLGECVTLI